MNDFYERFQDFSFAEKLAIIIGVPCILISTVQTAIGWHHTMGLLLLSIALSIVASGMMFALDLQMHHYKARGKLLRILVILLFYMAFASFSFIGNFNAFYTAIIKDELFTRELNRTRDYTKALENGYLGLIDGERDSVENNVQRLTQELRSEILRGTRGLIGCGPKCESLINQFERFGIAKPRVPPDYLTAEQQADRLENEINGNLQFRLQEFDEDNASIKEEIRKNLDSAAIQFAVVDDIGFFDDKRTVYEKQFKITARLYNDVLAQLEGYLSRQLNSEFPEITFDPGEVGKWSFSLNQAKRDMNSGSVTIIVVVIVCLLIDLVVPLVIIFFVRINTDIVIDDEIAAKEKEQKLATHRKNMRRKLSDWNDSEEDEDYHEEDDSSRKPDPAFIQKWRSQN